MIKINGVEILNDGNYPNGEMICKDPNILPIDIKDVGMALELELIYENDCDLFKLIFIKKYIDDKFKFYDLLKVNLTCKYLPYSRMDREIEGFIFSLKYVMLILNDLKFNVVRVINLHSNIPKQYSTLTEMSYQKDIDNIFNIENIDYVLLPDKGAENRYLAGKENIKIPVPIFSASKIRDVSNGCILDIKLNKHPELKNKTVLILDDLCAKGGTFIGVAKLLKDAGCKEVILYVTHCENSIYDGQILSSNIISKVYTTDSIFKKSSQSNELYMNPSSSSVDNNLDKIIII